MIDAVRADVILYSKSLDSAKTVKFWLITSCQCEIPRANPPPPPRAHIWTIPSKPGVVFVQHYLNQHATKFHKFF